jgi:hypothetical protein
MVLFHAKFNKNNIHFPHNMYNNFNVVTTCELSTNIFARLKISTKNITNYKKIILKSYVLSIVVARTDTMLQWRKGNNSCRKHIKCIVLELNR